MTVVKRFYLYNSLHQRIEPLEPDTPGQLKFYACGPTVYGYAHIGNFRSFLTADLIARTARALGWKVILVSNITDVGHLSGDDYADAQGEDKMQRALRSKEGEPFPTIWDLARYYADAFLDDWGVLNLQEPAVRPRATEHVPQQIESIQRLIDSGHAYETQMGVYFSVPSFPQYGRLSRNTGPDQLISTREVVVDPDKRDPRDFALWKKDTTHLMRWFSPWGWGFPGWHIECSAMAREYLGDRLDLHCGGIDNKFPHHDCEIAQSESLTGQRFARHWAHTGYLLVEGEKMSKSRGNFFTLRDLIYGGPTPGPYQVHPLAIRYALTGARYREPFNFTRSHLKDCAKLFERIQHARALGESAAESNRVGGDALAPALSALSEEILDAMLDDLNTSVAYAKLLRGAALINERGPTLTKAEGHTTIQWFERIDALLGLPGSARATHAPQQSEPPLEPTRLRIAQLIEERNAARRNSDFALADKIRAELREMGFDLRDSPQGTTWHRIVGD